MSLITVLTPTYNRAHTLPALYESLKQQAKNFEWLIVDDGSTDNTKDYIHQLIDENVISIRYVEQPNQGKHIALNTGVFHAIGDWIFIVDSDDYLTSDALNTLESDIRFYGENYELCYRKILKDGKIVGSSSSSKKAVLSATEAGKKFKGDLAYVFKKTTMQAHPFPQISHEKFVPELYIWNKISDQTQILIFPQKAIYICEYLEDGYTKRFKEHLKRNPLGFLLFYRDQLSRDPNIINKLKYFIRCIQCVYFLK